MKIFARTRKLTLKALKALHLFALIAGLLASPISDALQVELKTAMRVRQFSEDDGTLNSVGVLAAGSVVEIPDRYKVAKNGHIDSGATLAKWLKAAGYKRSTVNAKVRDPRLDFYFPVRIVKLAPGSSGRHLVGTTRFMALRVLQRSSAGLVVKNRSHVYHGTHGLLPLKPGMQVPSLASYAPPAQEQPPSQTQETQSVPQDDDSQSQSQSEPQEQAQEQTSQPQQTDDSQQSADDSTQTSEAGTNASDDCPDGTCDRANSGVARVADAARQVQDEVEPAVYDSEARGMQGITPSKFGFQPECRSFIRADGTYGPWGQKVLREMSKYPAYRSDLRGAERFCPRFNSFNDDQKRHFWVYLMAAVSSQEASCVPDKPAPSWLNPNGVAVGLFQIEESDYWRRENRTKVYHDNSCEGNPHSLNMNIRCGVRMIEAIIDHGDDPYTIKNNYYSSLRKPGRARSLVSKYEDCGAQAYTYSGRSRTHRRHRHHARRRGAR